MSSGENAILVLTATGAFQASSKIDRGNNNIATLIFTPFGAASPARAANANARAKLNQTLIKVPMTIAVR